MSRGTFGFTSREAWVCSHPLPWSSWLKKVRTRFSTDPSSEGLGGSQGLSQGSGFYTFLS